MNHEIVKARKELIAKREQEKNLSCYLRGMAGVYYRLANYNLAMQYTAFAEAVKDGDIKLSEKTAAYADTVKLQIARLAEQAAQGADAQQALASMLKVRDELTAAMQVMTAYTDRLYLHEYVLRRLAPAMENTVEEIDSYAALEEMSGFLFCDEEQEGLLARVALVVAELPVRMTKAKFMEWIMTTTAMYQDADAESRNRLLYMLECAAGLYEPEGMEQFPECAKVLAMLNGLEYKNLTEEQYFAAKEALEKITEYINQVTESHLSLMEIVNSLLSAMFTEGYVMPADLEATKGCREALRLVLSGDYEEEDLVEAFETFEGAPEETEEFLFTEEGHFEELSVDEKLLEAMLLKPLYTRVLYAKRLHSTSLFVSLEEEKEEAATLEAMIEEFCGRLSAVLEKGQRALNRAIMAQVIHNLPLPFTKKSDIQKYILSALENCHDMAEKTAAIREIRDLAEGI